MNSNTQFSAYRGKEWRKREDLGTVQKTPYYSAGSFPNSD